MYTISFWTLKLLHNRTDSVLAITGKTYALKMKKVDLFFFSYFVSQYNEYFVFKIVFFFSNSNLSIKEKIRTLQIWFLDVKHNAIVLNVTRNLKMV